MDGSSRALRFALVLASLAVLAGGCSLEDLLDTAPVRGLSAVPPALSDSVPSGTTQSRNRSVAITGPPWRAALAGQSSWLALGNAEAGSSRLTVSLNPAGLPPARYTDTVIVTSEAGSAVKVPVELVVLAAPDTTSPPPPPPPPPPPTATRLVFSVQPEAAVSGAPISPGVRVAAVDGSGNTVTAFRGSVTVVLATNPAAGTLSGTTTVTASDGVAVFSNLSLDRAGAGYSLRASTAGLAIATSSTFAVSPGPVSAARSTVTAVPAEIVASTGSSSSLVTLTARDAAGNLVPGAAVTFTVSGTGNTLSALSATTDGSGVATLRFSSTQATGKTVTAAVTGASLSTTVLVRPAPPFRLRFTVQPTTVEEDRDIKPAVVVKAFDAFDNVATDFRGDVAVSLEPNPFNARLGGDTTVRAAAGVAAFSKIKVDRWGGPFRIIAAAAGLIGAVSEPFVVTP